MMALWAVIKIERNQILQRSSNIRRDQITREIMVIPDAGGSRGNGKWKFFVRRFDAGKINFENLSNIHGVS